MTTLLELKTQARDRADMAESNFVSDSELLSYINNSIAELHDLLIAAYNEDYVMEDYEFSADGTSFEFDLPEDLYKLRGVDVKYDNDQWCTVKRFNFNRRNESQNAVTWNVLGLPFLEYRLVGNRIRFNAIPDVDTEFRLFYNPKATALAVDADEYDDINGFSEYVIVDAAIKMLNKEESDVSVLMAQKEALKLRIQNMAANRDANEPESVTDIYAEDSAIEWVGRR